MSCMPSPLGRADAARPSTPSRPPEQIDLKLLVLPELPEVTFFTGIESPRRMRKRVLVIDVRPPTPPASAKLDPPKLAPRVAPVVRDVQPLNLATTIGGNELAISAQPATNSTSVGARVRGVLLEQAWQATRLSSSYEVVTNLSASVDDAGKLNRSIGSNARATLQVTNKLTPLVEWHARAEVNVSADPRYLATSRAMTTHGELGLSAKAGDGLFTAAGTVRDNLLAPTPDRAFGFTFRYATPF